MDFASALANLQKSANAAANNDNSGRGDGRGGGGGRGDGGRGGGGRGGAGEPYYGPSRGGDSYYRGGGGRGRGSEGRHNHQHHYHSQYSGQRRPRSSQDSYYQPPGGGEGGGTRHHSGHYEPRSQRPRHDSGRSPPRGSGSGYYGRSSGGGDGRGAPSSGRHRGGPFGSGGGGGAGFFEGMLRAGYRVNAYRNDPNPPRSSPEKDGEVRKGCYHICLLALTIDDLPYEQVWREWAKGAADSAGGGGSGNDPQPHHPRIVVSLACHAKFPDKVRSEWLRQRLLVRRPRIGRGNEYADPEYFTHKPEWGSVQLTRAMVDCLSNAMKLGNDAEKDPRFSSRRFVVSAGGGSSSGESSGGNESGGGTTTAADIPPVDTFIFVSETCLPVRTLPECAREIYGEDAFGGVSGNAAAAGDSDEKEDAHNKKEGDGAAAFAKLHQSWAMARSRKMPGTPRNMYERDQFQAIDRVVPQVLRYKSDQWILLSRWHASLVLELDRHLPSPAQLWNCFSKLSASDEMYFPTALAVLGLLKDDETASKKSGAAGGSAAGGSAATAEEGQQAAEEPSASNKDAAGAASTTTGKSSSEPQMQHIVRRQVTYVDWSEGMRNPASYDKGMRDFRRVAKLARANGSLFARKFVPFVPVPGKEPAVTGMISADEWREHVERLAEEDGASAKTAAANPKKEGDNEGKSS